MINHSLNKNPSVKRKQKGATLLTVMIFLVLMTIVTVSATKISILDILISGNDQQRVVAFQETENNLKKLAQKDKFNLAISSNGFNNVLDQYKLDESTTELNKKITDMMELYNCERAGKGSGMGPNAPKCMIYDFKVKHQKQNSGVREEHHQGGGKMRPNGGSKGSFL